MTDRPFDIDAIAQALVAPGKGILAADESTGTIEKRFAAVGVESTAESRRAYRNLLFATPGVEAHLSGVILFDETIRQTADDGTPFAELLVQRGMIPGIKVDRGTKPLAGASGEKVTEGLDGLRERLEATSPWRGSRANRDYLVRGIAPTHGAFHPKTYLVADERAGVLFVGSGNLGMSGLESGKEIFSRFDSTDPEGLRAIRAWRSWMDGIVGRLVDDTVRTRWHDAQVRAPWLIGPLEPGAFVSNWERPLLEQLLDGVAAPVDEVWLTAPFYDRDLGALSALIEATRPARISLLLGRDTSVDGQQLVGRLAEAEAEVD